MENNKKKTKMRALGKWEKVGWGVIFGIAAFIEFLARKVRLHAGDKLWPIKKPEPKKLEDEEDRD